MPTYAQIYCTTAELIHDLRLSGDEPELQSRIRAASKDLENMLGHFIPVLETRTFYPNQVGEINIDPILSVVSVTNDTTPIAAATSTTDGYKLDPGARCYPQGPYSQMRAGWTPWSANGVHILAYWGKYDETRALNVSGVTQLSDATTLVVSDGSQVSAGMVVLVETEQELITGGNGDEDSPGPTLATSLLNGAITADDEEITVDNGAEFHRGETIRLGTEDCFIRRIVGHVLVAQRGWNGTTKAAHANDLAVYVYRTFVVQRGVNGTSAAAHTNKAVYRYTVPDDVNWLTRQVAGLMRMKAAAGFANKSGNAELGETFYYSEFPPNQINAIKANYRVY